MAFKLGNEKRHFKHSGNVKLVQAPLDKGTVAEARNDGTIVVNPSVKPGEFSFFSWDLEKDIILDGSATATGAVEAILFLRTSSE